MKSEQDGRGYYQISIPTVHEFINQWYPLIFSEVNKLFKKGQERVEDTVQNVVERLVRKDFIGRWFFKLLTDELVDRTQAENMLGGISLKHKKKIQPVVGKSTDINSLYRVSDILDFAKFNHERYYYSIQGHTIDSDRVLELLGYKAGQYSALQSLWRQGKLLPSELTEHECARDIGSSPDECDSCKEGLNYLKERGVSLDKNDWNNPNKARLFKKLRWDDRQLAPFLRGWKKSNIIKCVPRNIIRLVESSGVDASLLGYAKHLIANEVRNDFKRMKRTYDLTLTEFNHGRCPEVSDQESVSWEFDEMEETSQRVFRDTTSMLKYHEFECCNDLRIILTNSGLSAEQMQVILETDLQGVSVRGYAIRSSKSAQKVHHIRSTALKHICDSISTESSVKQIVMDVCSKYNCTLDDITGPGMFGNCVTARTELYSDLLDRGWDIGDIISKFSVSEDRVVAAVNRRVIQEMRS